MILLGILIVLLVLLAPQIFFIVPQQNVYIIERLGKFNRTVGAGLNIKIPFFETVAAKVDMRTRQEQFTIDAKTRDNVTVTMAIAAQYRVSAQPAAQGQPSGVWRSYYMLANPTAQMRSYLIDALRSSVPQYTLDEVFDKKDAIASDVNQTVSGLMVAYGYDVVSTLITAIDLPADVEQSMNRINSAQREKEAAQSLAEAERIKVVTEARARAEAMEQAREMGLEGTVPYATTLLNIATAYRACGRLQESREYYAQVQEIYDSQLEPDSMLMAGLKNNIALLYQETGDFAAAKEKLLEALAIVSGRGVAYETAVTCANLASTCMQLEQKEEACDYARRSVEIFQREKVEDSHYAAALATLGAYSYHGRDFRKALEYYTRGMEAVERNLGRNEYYHRLQENAAACERALALEGQGAGLALARQYYESCGRQMIEERFPAYAGRIAVGLAGRGSDCFGYGNSSRIMRGR